MSLNPILAAKISDQDIVHLFGGNLFELRGTANSGITNGLAKSYHTTNNGLDATITLRPNLRFSDGSSLTATDVAATLNWAMNDPANAFPGIFAPIASVTVSGSSTVELTFKQSYPDFPAVAADTEFSVLPAKYLTPTPVADNSSFFNDPISAGPYRLAAPWTGSGDVTLVRNPYYWGPKPVVPRVVFTTVSDETARVDELKSGQVDMIDELDPSIVKQLTAQGFHAEAMTSFGDILLDMNDHDPILSNVNVRRAISLALNRNQMSQIAFSGVVPPLAGFWPQSMTGYDPSISTSQNIQEAKTLLAGTPCANGCTLQLIYSLAVSPFDPALIPILQSNLAAIGIHINPVQLDGTTLVADVFHHANYQLAQVQSYDTSGNIPDVVLTIFLLSNGRGGNVGGEASHYQSPQMDALIHEAIQSSGSARTSALNQIEQLFQQDQPWAPIAPFFNGVASRVPTSAAYFDHSLFVQVARESS